MSPSTPDRALLARAGGTLFAVAGVLGLVAMLFPGGAGTSAAAEAGTSAAALGLGVALWLGGERLPFLAYQALGLAATTLASVSAYYGGTEGWLNGFYYFWVALFAAYFFPPLLLGAQVAAIAAEYGAVLALGPKWRHPGLIWFVTVSTVAVTAALVAFLRLRLERALQAEHRQVERLRELDRLKDDFVATVSHELRTPVAAVYGAVQTLRGQQLEPRIRDELLRIVEAESQRLAELTSDVLQSTALDRRSLRLQLGPVDAFAEAREAVDAVRARAEGRAIELTAQPGLRPVHADPARLRQVVVNLLDNALKYSPPEAAVTVDVTAAQSGTRIAVRDQGDGIPPGERERVFEKFHRLDPQMRRGVGGSGLGLYIVRGLVEAMGGRVWIEPAAAGRPGTTVIVELPEGEGDVAADVGLAS